MKYAPIALFVYNRADHAKETFEKLIDNIEFEDSLLYVFCDGAKTEKDKLSVQSTRKLVHSYELENAIIIESEHNKGLAKSIVDGINHILHEHDRVIVLEDDCVPSPDFLYFMNACLCKYESNERVMNISAYSPPIEIPEDYPYDVYFSHRFSSWGWATWKKAWEHYSNDPKTLETIENSNVIKKKIDTAGLDIYPMLKRQVNGKLNSWAVFWAVNILMNDGLSVNPVKSRIQNIGHDGSGTHCSPDRRYDVQINKEKKSKIAFPDKVEPDKRIVKANYDFRAGSFYKRILYLCYHKVSKFINISI